MMTILEGLNGRKAACLRQLGILPFEDAYWELITAMQILEQSPTMLASIHKLLYAEIAKKCDRSAASIEKAFRGCIFRHWQEASWEVLRPYLAVSKRPTNSQFLTALMMWYADMLGVTAEMQQPPAACSFAKCSVPCCLPQEPECEK